nr:uncharacterized protein I203_02584 [Kwoniella mangroviensis CBS 8507]OCF67926.1 hypothetical protein I203_02584 [Kwoniella mangroviensis CBS 8507]
MLFKSLISLSLLLFTSATPTPLFGKRDESIVKVMTTSYTRISHVNDLKNVALNGLESCYVEVNKNFRGTAKYNLNLGPPHITLISGTLDAQKDIGFICPKADAQCSLPEGDKGCDDLPGWDGKGASSRLPITSHMVYD